MSRIDVCSRVMILERDGDEVPFSTVDTLDVESHAHQRRAVVLRIGDKRITVDGPALERAIRNAMNSKP